MDVGGEDTGRGGQWMWEERGGNKGMAVRNRWRWKGSYRACTFLTTFEDPLLFCGVAFTGDFMLGK